MYDTDTEIFYHTSDQSVSCSCINLLITYTTFCSVGAAATIGGIVAGVIVIVLVLAIAVVIGSVSLFIWIRKDRPKTG